MTLEELEKEVSEIKARSAADLAFIRCAMFTLSTAQLRGVELTMSKLSEDMTVRLLYMSSASDTANNAFDERRKFWLDALQAEVTARDAANRL